jgi:putative membrane protein
MINILFYFVANVITILGLSKFLDDFQVRDTTSAFVFILALTLLNYTIIPVIKFLTFPINFFTIGIFNGVLNVVVILLLTSVIKGVEITSTGFAKFVTAFIIVITLSVVQSIIGKFNG